MVGGGSDQWVNMELQEQQLRSHKAELCWLADELWEQHKHGGLCEENKIDIVDGGPSVVDEQF